MGKIVVVGSSNTDLVVNAKKLPAPGETVLGGDFSIISGGKGANQAVAAARAGSDVTFVSKVGNDYYGKRALQEYKKENINLDYIFTDISKPSGVAVILVDEETGQNSIVVAPGANSSLSIEDIKEVETEISLADIVLIQLEIPLATVEYVLHVAKKNGVKTILNPAPAQPLSDELLGMVDIITPNESETEILIGINPVNENQLNEAASRLLSKVGEAVLITLGEKGVYIASKNEDNKLIPSIKVKAVDSTAAGDVFNGYLASALSQGMFIEEAIVLANRAAATSVTRRGAQPSIPRVDELGVLSD
jgi:ribokinase